MLELTVRHDEDRLPIYRRLRDKLGADHGGGARTIVHQDLLAPALGEFLRDQLGKEVGAA